MISFAGNLYGGPDSRRQRVRIQTDPSQQRLVVVREGNDCEPESYPLSGIRISSRLGNTPRWLTLEGELKIETPDNDAVDQLIRYTGKQRSLWLHRLESRWTWMLLFVAIVATSTWGFTVYGLPQMARNIAFALPQEISQELGKRSLESLDQLVFTPTQLSTERQQQLQRHFQQMLQQIDAAHASPNKRRESYRLVFRDSPPLGANAFALPSGTLVMTDALVELADSDLELISVLAHEIGHVEYRHSLRRAIQSSVLPLIIMSVTGDVSSATALVATLPTLALEASYSQGFEQEADSFAGDYLQQQGISAEHFINLLQKLDQAHPDETPAFFSSHPATRKRVEALKAD